MKISFMRCNFIANAQVRSVSVAARRLSREAHSEEGPGYVEALTCDNGNKYQNVQPDRSSTRNEIAATWTTRIPAPESEPGLDEP
jgi:hypothetical protein